MRGNWRKVVKTYKLPVILSTRDIMYSMTTTNTNITHRKVKRISPMSYHKENFFSFFLFFYCIYEKMDVGQTCCGDHFTIHVNQTIMLYILNLYSDVCQLYLNKTEKTNKVSLRRSRYFICYLLYP